MYQITRTKDLVDRVRRNHHRRMTIAESAADIGVSFQTLRRMEIELGLVRLKGGFRRSSTSRYAAWEGAHFLVICLCGTYCIVAKRSRNPKYEIAKRMAIQEIVYEARGESEEDLIALARRWDKEYHP